MSGRGQPRASRRPTIVIVGLGLIGGSLARALSARGKRVVGVDRRAEVLRAARRCGAIAVSARRLEPALRQAEVLVLAAPPQANRTLLRRVAQADRSPRLVVTDVSSVKRTICADAGRLPALDFVGGHPMAGRERGGFAASNADLFRGRPWALVPVGSGRALGRVRALVRSVGARPVLVEAAAHDRAVAFLSHLPQLVAWALRDAANGDGVARAQRRLAGPGFRDTTRLAASPRRLWREILGANRDEIRRALRSFRSALAASARAL